MCMRTGEDKPYPSKPNNIATPGARSETTMLLGTYTLSIKTKDQLALPLEVLQDLTRAGGYITRGLDQNILLLTSSAFHKMYAQLTAISVTDPLARMLGRMILGNAGAIDIDKNGTLRLPAELADHAQLGDEIVLVGQGEYIELWSSAAWKKQLEKMEGAADEQKGFEKFNVSVS